MAAPTSVDFKTCFALNTTPKTFKFTDLTDYAGQSTPTSEVVGVFKIVSPSGSTHYNNTNFAAPDIDVDVSTQNSTTITIPLDAAGKPEEGIYTITYTVRHNDGVTITDITKVRTFDFCYTSPTVVVALSVNCITPLLTSKDSTSYTHTFDSTVVVPTIVRTHTLYYPPSLGLAATTGSAASLTASTFYTQTHSSTISSVLTYDVSANYCVEDTVTGGDEIDVDCNDNLCSIFCCVENLYVRYNNAKGVNRTKASDLKAKMEEVGFRLILLQSAYDCGDADQISTLVADIQNISECTADCDCTGDQPVLVQGAGVAQITAVAAGGGITVTVATSGNTKTYTVSLQAALLTKLNASYNATVAAGSGITVTPVTDGSGNKTYTVALSGTLYSPNAIELRTEIKYSNFAAPTVNFAGTSISKNGTNMTNPTVESVGHGTDPNWKSLNNLFKVSAFQTTANNTYKVHLEAANLGLRPVPNTPSAEATAAEIYLLGARLGVDLLDVKSGEFYFSFYETGTGKRYTNEAMLVFSKIGMNIRIEE